MGRHALSAPRRRRRLWPLLPLLLVVAIGVVAVERWDLAVPGLSSAGASQAEEPAVECAGTVRVTVAPELADPVSTLLADPVPVGEQECVDVDVAGEQPLQTVASLSAVTADRLPQLWVPDSSVWLARAAQAPVTLEPLASVASSPVVVATSRSAVEELGWAASPPTWGQAMTSGRSVAVPDIASSPEGLAALAAVRASLGGGEDAENAVVQTVLAAARGEVPSVDAAVEQASGGAADAALVPLSEQEVFAANRGQDSPALVAVYPADGSPFLDYPLVRVAGDAEGAPPQEWVDAVAERLTSDAASAAVRRAGFRTAADARLATGDGSGVQQEAPANLVLSAEEVGSLLARLTSLAKPSRLLAVVDVSTSMQAAAGQGQTRITLARDATRSALALFPDSASIGLWVFASELGEGTDWQEVAPIRGLTEDTAGAPHRQVLATALDSLPDRLAAGGTSLYDTTLGAVRAAREAYDESSVSTVVLITDGRNEDSTSVTLEELEQTLQAEADPDRPVRVVAIGLGPDADNDALARIAEATGGSSYTADDPNDLQTVLFDALRRRG